MSAAHDDTTVDADWCDIVRAFGRMPYGAALSSPRLDVHVVDHAALARTLVALVDRLHSVSETERELRAELDRYRRLIGAARDFVKLLGVEAVTS